MKKTIISMTLVGLTAVSAQAATVTWDGGGGVDTDYLLAANWGGDTADTLPVDGDTVTIGSAFTVTSVAATMLPSTDGVVNIEGTINASSNIRLGAGGASVVNSSIYNLSGSINASSTTRELRMYAGTTMNISSGAGTTGRFIYTNNDITTNFILSSTGFDSSNLNSAAVFSDLAGNFIGVDMSAYLLSSGAQTITLFDFTDDAFSGGGGQPADLTSAYFEANVGQSVTNVAAGLAADIIWDDASDSFQLVVTAVPEPSTTALLGLGGLALIMRRRK